MKKYLFTGLVAALMMTACKKDYTAAFNTSSSNYYLYQTITFNNTSKGGTSSWDFGDGTKSTDKSPTHVYNQPGNYTVTLTDGSSVATKTLTVYHGYAAFQVDNETSQNLPMFTFAADAAGYAIDYIDQGTVSTHTKGALYYTTDSVIYVGGQIPNLNDTTFIAATPYRLVKDSVNNLQVNSNTPVYLQNIPNTQTKVQSIRIDNAAVLPKKNLSSIIKR
ncbi:MAG: PKD domain-containing protein [Mucilaginibacter sp.]